jgi:hypothetical protein
MEEVLWAVLSSHFKINRKDIKHGELPPSLLGGSSLYDRWNDGPSVTAYTLLVEEFSGDTDQGIRFRTNKY